MSDTTNPLDDFLIEPAGTSAPVLNTSANPQTFAGSGQDHVPAAPAGVTQPVRETQPVSSPVAPAPAPAVPGFDTAAFLSTLDRQVEATVRRALPQPAAPAAPEEADPFAGENLDLTPEDEAIFGDPRVRNVLDKATKRAIRDYDRKTGAPTRQKLREYEDSTRQAQAQAALQLQQTGLAAAVPDYAALMADPAYAQFANELIEVPNSAVPIRRSDALGMALTAGNFGYIGQQFAALRSRRAPAAAPAAPAAPATFAAPAAPVQQPAGGSPGISAPPPGMHALSPRTYSKVKLEKRIMELAGEVQRNPRDAEALKSYNDLRGAYQRAAAAGSLR